MMEPAGVHGSLNVHVELDDVQDHL
jgi:hypothetical protein